MGEFVSYSFWGLLLVSAIFMTIQVRAYYSSRSDKK
jgi:hypothetical protein